MAKGKHVRFASQDVIHEIEARTVETQRPVDPRFWDDPVALRLLSGEEARPQDCNFFFKKWFKHWEKTTFDEADDEFAEEAEISTMTEARYRSIPRSPVLSPLPSFSPPAEAVIEEIVNSATVSKDELGQWWMKSRMYNRLLRPALKDAVLRQIKSKVKTRGERDHEEELMKKLTPALESWASRGEHEHEIWMANRFPEPVPETAGEIQAKREEIAKMRDELEACGLSPCYPSGILYRFPADAPPLVKALGGYERSLLVQKEAWEEFLSSRLGARKGHKFEYIIKWFEKAREKWGFQHEDYMLKPNPDEQDAFTTWLEYQNAELSKSGRVKEVFERRRNEFYQREFLTEYILTLEGDERKLIEQAAAELKDLIEQVNKYTEYLPWIEQQRVKLQKAKAEAGRKDSTKQDNADSSKVPPSKDSSKVNEQTNENTDKQIAQNIAGTTQTELGHDLVIDADGSSLSSLSSETPTTPEGLDLTRDSPLSSLSTTPERPPSHSPTALPDHSSSPTAIKRSRTGRILKQPVRYAEEKHIDKTKNTKKMSTKRGVSKKQERRQQAQTIGVKRKSPKQAGNVAGKKSKVTPAPYQTGRGRTVVVPRRYPEPD